MDMSVFALTDRVAIVTGSGRGIGKGIALALADAGANVVVVARTAADIEATAAEIIAKGRRALAVPTDVREPEQVADMLQKTMDAFGRVDILVNNAGGFSRAQVLDMDYEVWEDTLKENLTSIFICSKIIAGQMAQQKEGNIINISSIAATGPWPGAAAYGVTKAGIINFTQTLAEELAPYNIRVNVITPGFIKTPGTDKLWKAKPEWLQVLDKIPMHRRGDIDEIATTAIFLASDASSYITGESIIVAGGLSTTVVGL